jgi:hypothetical protein
MSPYASQYREFYKFDGALNFVQRGLVRCTGTRSVDAGRLITSEECEKTGP